MNDEVYLKNANKQERENEMKIGEVCLNTNDVIQLADFYKAILDIKFDSDDEVHQILIADEAQLSIYNDGTKKNNNNQNICLAFTVEDMNAAYQKLLKLGVRIIEEPTSRPWGATNMSFYDPDDNVVYFRSFPKK